MVSNTYRKEKNGIERYNEDDSFYLNEKNFSFVTNKKGELIEVSDLFCKKLGCVKDDILGLTLEDTGLLTEESRKKMMYRNV
ncbi:unnamed protein product, partial [marine sediment metagenome]